VSAVYVHGYHPRENERLQDQAGTLVDLLHSDTSYPSGSVVLEAGCGVGAQTVTLAQRSPNARFVSVDRAGSGKLDRAISGRTAPV
jgi:tRNA G46 methylase TrmB